MISSFISGRAGELESLDLRSSRALIFSNISVGIGSVLSRCRPEGCCVKNNGTQDLFSFLAVVGSRLVQLVFNLYCIGPSFPSQVDEERCCIGLIVTSICKLMRIGRWSEHRFVLRLPVGRSDKRG